MSKPDKPLIYFFLIELALAWAVMAFPIANRSTTKNLKATK